MNEEKVPQSSKSTIWAAVAIMTASFAYWLTRGKATAIMPIIAGDLDGMAFYTWAAMLYNLAACIAAPLWGKIGDMLGRKKVLIMLLSLMTAGDLVSAAAPNIYVFCIGFAICGLGGGGMQATYFAMLGDLFAPDKRGKYGGTILMLSSITGIFLPIVTAQIAERASWRYVFVLTCAVYVIAIISVTFMIPKSQVSGKSTKVDWVGTILITFAAVPFLLALSWAGSKYAWTDPTIIIMLAVAVVFLIIAVIYERKHEDFALLSIKLLRRKNYTFAILISLFMTSTLTASGTFWSLFGQGVMSKSATMLSAAAMPASIIGIFTGGLTGYLMDKTKRYKWLLVLAPLAGTIIMVLFNTASPSTPLWFVTAMAIANRIFTGYMPGINPLAAMAQLEPEEFGAGNGTMYFITSLGGSIYPALFGSVLNGSYARAIAKATASISKQLTPAQIKTISTSRVLVTPASMKSLQTSFGTNTALYNQTVDAVRSALESSLKSVFIVAGIFSLGAVVMALLIKEVPLDQIKYRRPTAKK